MGLGVLWRTRRGDLRAILAVALPYLALVAFYRVWWGEWGPAARYLAPLAPLAIAPLAAWAGQVRRAVALVAIGLLALPGFAIMAGFLAAPQLMYNQPDGTNALFSSWAASVGQGWPKFLPSFQPYAPSPIRVRQLWSLWLAALAALLCGLGLLLPPRAEPHAGTPAEREMDQGAVRV